MKMGWKIMTKTQKSGVWFFQKVGGMRERWVLPLLTGAVRLGLDGIVPHCMASSFDDQQRLQISELHVDKSPTPTSFACWKIRFNTEVCTCSQFPTEAMLWIKEVEMVESVDDLKSSRSIRGTPGPDFELLDARIASALDKIIQNTRVKKKVSFEEIESS